MSGRSRRLFVPEVVQTSNMDCGPAALKALLDGFSVPVSYGHLRDACQTELDGTSIDALEDVANALGLEAWQGIHPVEHVLAAEGRLLPALAVVKLPDGNTHFVVIWRRLGPLVEMMDPAVGRRVVRAASLADELYVHEMTVPAALFDDMVRGPAFEPVLTRRLARLLGAEGAVSRLATAAAGGTGALAALEATTRFVTSLVEAGAIDRASRASFFDHVLANAESLVPPEAWFGRMTEPDADGVPQVRVRGALLVSVAGGAEGAVPTSDLSRAVARARTEQRGGPLRESLGLLGRAGISSLAVLAFCMLLAGLLVAVESLVLRALLDLGRELASGPQQLAAVAALTSFFVVLLVVDLSALVGARRLGRHVEIHLRIAFLRALPRLPHRYFRSRLQSDLAGRAHSVHQVRDLLEVVARILRATAELFFTAVAVAWLAPALAPVTLAVGVLLAAAPLLASALLSEADHRARSHAGALVRCNLDALLGVVPIRAHGSARAVLCEHEGLLLEWERAARRRARLAALLGGAQMTVGFVFSAWLVWRFLALGGAPGKLLLLLYWALRMSTLSRDAQDAVEQLPSLRTIVRRLLEPLSGAREARSSDDVASDDVALPAGEPAPAGVALELRNVAVTGGGRDILRAVDLSLAPGEQVAVVGPSGSGKSTFVGLLLGLQAASAGEVLVDDAPLDASSLARLRGATAWGDPAVYLWNRSLFANVVYGEPAASGDAGAAVVAAGLSEVVERLPNGLQSPLGDHGGLLSAGEGQRVRIARAFLRRTIRLVVLDEALRGLGAERRAELLRGARARWPGATLLYVTHDMREAVSFPRVLVLDDGALVEDGSPSALAAEEGSRFARLIAAHERLLGEESWSLAWRRLRLDGGRLVEHGQASES